MSDEIKTPEPARLTPTTEETNSSVSVTYDCPADEEVVKGPSVQDMEAYSQMAPMTGRKIHYHRSAGDICISIFTYLINGFFAFVCIYPFYYIFINSISNNDYSKRGKVLFLPKEVHFTNYKNVLQLDGLFDALKISVARTFFGTLLTVVIAAFLGYMFTRETLWGRKFWYRFVAITMYFNAGIIPWFLTMKNLHLDNNFLAYILPVAVSPFYIILCKTFIESIPKELQDAAEIDGAGTLRIFFSIILPVIKPILATVAIFAAVAQWNSFQDTLLLVTDKKLYTLQYMLYNYIKSSSSLAGIVNNSTNTNLAATLAHSATATSIRMTVTIVVVTPIVLVYPFFQRYFTKGIMIGAVKG